MKLLVVTILGENRQQLIEALETIIADIEEAKDLASYSQTLDGEFPQMLIDVFDAPVEVRDIYKAQEYCED